MKKKIIILIIILIIISLGLFFWLNQEPEVQFETEKAARQDIFQTVSVTGTVLAVERADLAFEATGKIKEIWVEVGDEVKKGDKIARVDGSVLYSQVKEKEALLAIEEAELQNMRRHWDDYSPDEQDAQKRSVDNAAASVQTARASLSKTAVYSPMDGIVAKRYFDQEEVATFSEVVATIIKPGDLEIEVDVPESDIALIQIGQVADIELDAFDDKDKFKAEVTEIDPSSTEISDVVYYKVTLRFENIDSRFLDGMSVDADIHTAERKDVLAVPARAVKDGTGQEYVEVVQPDGSLREANVETGLKGDDGNIEIISGLSAGDDVVTVKKNGKK